MARCIDRTDQTTQNAEALPVGPAVDPNGIFTRNQIDVLAQEIAENIAKDAETNPILIAVNTYGNQFYDAVIFINGAFRETFVGDYPDLQKRWSKGNITNLEFADFINRYALTPDDVTGTRDFEKLARSLNNYYKESFSLDILGGFCNAIPQIFGYVDAFFDILAQIDAIIGKAMDILNKIRSYDNFLEFLEQEIIKKLIDEIKEKILEIIGQVWQEILDIIENFNILGITIEDVVSFDAKIMKAIMTQKEMMCATMSDKNKKSFIDRVRAKIDYFINLLESPTLEQIYLFVARLCALAANIEALIRDIKSPLDNFSGNYQRVVNRISNIGKIGTSTAIRAGAIRYSPEKRREEINKLKALHRQNAQRTAEAVSYKGTEKEISLEPITREEYGNLPKCGAVIRGTDSRLKINAGWLEDDDLGPVGYAKIDLDVKVYLMRLQEKLGRTIVITEGWRSKEYNEKVGGPKDSSHLSGMVVDIENPGIEQEQFEQYAFESGFKHIVLYGGTIHLDIREMAR